MPPQNLPMIEIVQSNFKLPDGKSIQPLSKRDILVNKSGSKVALGDWGYPGHLTEDEFRVYEQFRKEVFSRNEDFRATVFSFQKAHEDEDYAMCRWLRARKYDIYETIKMVEEATECTSEARKHNFYPSASDALGCDKALYIKQYPQCYYGHARNGCPVFYSKPALIDINSIESLTSLVNIINFHWNAMMHDFNKYLEEQYMSSNGQFKRYECIVIMDLKHLTTSQLSKRCLKLIKEQSSIDSLCFPETLNHMAIVNAPGFFALTWKLIRSWIDPRTANKVSVISSNKDKICKHLTKFIDKDSLAADYGGNGMSINEVLNEDMILQFNSSDTKEDRNFMVKNTETFILSLRNKSSAADISVEKDRIIKISFHTRSVTGGKVVITDENGDRLTQVPEGGMNIKHKGISEDNETELPTCYDLEKSHGIILKGPGNYKIELFPNAGKHILRDILVAKKEVIMKPVISCKNRTKGKSQAGQDTSIVLSSRSICSGTFGVNQTDDGILLFKPVSMIRKEKRVFQSEILGVRPKA